MVRDAPNSPGVYCVWSGESIIYVGSSEKMRQRMIDHGRAFDFLANKADRVTWIIVASERMLPIEAEMIGYSRPLLNETYVPRMRHSPVFRSGQRTASHKRVRPESRRVCYGIVGMAMLAGTVRSDDS
jgi:excinuclease UvrABC nuclease subunit